MIGDPTQISYLELSKLLDHDDTFAREALAVLGRDYARPKSTYTTATSATALLAKWVERRELRCEDERGQVVTDFNAEVHRGDDGYQTALASVESGWLIDRASFVQLVDRYGMMIPEAVAFQPGPDSTLLQRHSDTRPMAQHMLSLRSLRSTRRNGEHASSPPCSMESYAFATRRTARTSNLNTHARGLNASALET